MHRKQYADGIVLSALPSPVCIADDVFSRPISPVSRCTKLFTLFVACVHRNRLLAAFPPVPTAVTAVIGATQ